MTTRAKTRKWLLEQRVEALERRSMATSQADYDHHTATVDAIDGVLRDEDSMRVLGKIADGLRELAA